MEKSRGSEGRFIVWCLLGLFLLLNLTMAEGEEYKDPTGRVNLSPFQQWLNAYLCLQNTSSPCPEKYKLTEKGWMGVSPNETDTYCKACVKHTRWELNCIHQVRKKYKFYDGTTVGDVSNALTSTCPGSPAGAA